MKFTHPYFLFGLLAILIPIIIHLFNFRRYKTTYFSNVKLLQDVVLKTKRESQLQHLLVLLLRILGIAALAFAFAQPYLPKGKESTSSGRVIAIFVDNSYSMEASSKNASLLQDALGAAKSIVDAFDFSDDFILITNDFSPQESSLLNKDEIITLLDEVTLSNQSRKWNELRDFSVNVASYAQGKELITYYISDFQKTQFDFSAYSPDTTRKEYLLQMPSAQLNNISIDSCWFTSPVFTLGQQIALTVRIHNYGATDIMKLPVKLYLNDKQRALTAVDLKANSYADVSLQYVIESAGIQRGVLQIEDAPITFDDQLYFVYEVSEATPVIAIERKNTTNKYVQALYGRDSLFLYKEMAEDQVNYSQFNESQLIVLDEISALSSGLSDELTDFLYNGGRVLVFPSEEMQKETWNVFLQNMGVVQYQEIKSGPMKVGKINMESPYFKGTMEQTSTQVAMPTALKYYGMSRTSSVPSETILTLDNGDPLLSAYTVGRGKLFLSAVAMNDYYGDAHKHALFFVPLHNIGIMSVMRDRLYYVTGRDEVYVLSEKANHSEHLFYIKSRQEDYEFIPEQRASGNKTNLYFHDQVQIPGFYDILKDNIETGSLAFNDGREESSLDYYSEKELEELTRSSQNSIQLIDPKIKNLTDQISGMLDGTPLWRYFIIIALACFLAEILLLRFWGRVPFKQD